MDSDSLTRDDVDRLAGQAILEFGASWCGHCHALAPLLAAELRAHPDVRHIKIEDGPGKPLGRSFRVKLWPTLVFLRDGAVRAIAVRPSRDEIRHGFEKLVADEGDEVDPAANA
jgi:thioredoxin 1